MFFFFTMERSPGGRPVGPPEQVDRDDADMSPAAPTRSGRPALSGVLCSPVTGDAIKSNIGRKSEVKTRTTKRKTLTKHLLTTFVIFLTAGAMAPLASAAVEARPALSPDDCAKCHDAAPKAIEEAGGKHKTSVTCIDCHQGHPPKDADIIPQCSMCHSGKEHYKLDNCLRCHSNPHTPLAISFNEDHTDACLTCHTEQIDQLRKQPTKHTELFCSNCHTQHGEIPECTTCHAPHASDMVQADCLACHKAHMPKPVTYPDDISSKHCASCHDVAYNLLQASPYKHKDVACADCHKTEHKMIPQCQDCHGVPHPPAMMSKFPTCGACHGIAHDIKK